MLYYVSVPLHMLFHLIFPPLSIWRTTIHLSRPSSDDSSFKEYKISTTQIPFPYDWQFFIWDYPYFVNTSIVAFITFSTWKLLALRPIPGILKCSAIITWITWSWKEFKKWNKEIINKLFKAGLSCFQIKFFLQYRNRRKCANLKCTTPWFFTRKMYSCN